MLYKVTNAKEAYQYEIAGSYDARHTRLHEVEDLENGKISVGISLFLPYGGIEMAIIEKEVVCYVLSGELMVTTNDDSKKHILEQGDSIRLLPGSGIALKNDTVKICEIMIITAAGE